MRRFVLGLVFALAGAMPAHALQPTGEGSCVLWLRTDVNNGFSDLGTTPVTNGGSIEQYNDACAGANNVTQTSAGSRPTWQTGVFNGNAAIKFAGQYLVEGTGSAAAEPNTIIIGYILTSACNGSTDYGLASAHASSGSGSASRGWMLMACESFATGVPYARMFGRNNAGAYMSVSTYGEAFVNVPVVMAVCNTGTQLLMYTEGTQIRAGSITGTPAVLDTTLTVIGAGQFSGSANAMLPGYIFEFQKYTSNVCADVPALVADVKTRYGITHPTGTLLGSFSQSSGSGQSDLDHNLYLVDSSNGQSDFSWHPTEYIPATGVDSGRPSIAQFAPTQDFWLAFGLMNGGGAAGAKIYIAKSTNALTDPVMSFADVTSIDVSSVTGTGGGALALHPRWFVDTDNTVHLTVSLANGTTRVPYEVHPLNGGSTNCVIADNCQMASWSGLTQITGSAFPSILGDPKLTKSGASYYLMGTDETTSEIPAIFSSTSPFSGYGAETTLARPASGIYSRSFITNVGGTWTLYEDLVSAGSSGYFYATSSNDPFGTYGTFTAINSPFVSPGQLQSGDIFTPIPGAACAPMIGGGTCGVIGGENQRFKPTLVIRNRRLANDNLMRIFTTAR